MNIKKILLVFLALCIFAVTIASATVSAADLRTRDVEKILSLRKGMENNVRITDIRNNLSSINARYTVAQLEEIINIVNDAASKSLAEEEYYIDLSEEFSEEQISEIYRIVADTESDVSVDDDTTDKSLMPNQKGIVIIVCIGLAVILMIAVLIFILVRRTKERRKNMEKMYILKDASKQMPEAERKYNSDADAQGDGYDESISDEDMRNKLRLKSKNNLPKPAKKAVIDDD